MFGKWSPIDFVMLVLGGTVSLCVFVTVCASWFSTAWSLEDSELVVGLLSGMLTIISMWVGSQIQSNAERPREPPGDV